jgi:pyrimidine operon attenuation protein/uracil phosphoribosyltransferase
VVLVDDVLYTGRTIRAGLDAMLAFGRPASSAAVGVHRSAVQPGVAHSTRLCGRWVDSIGDQRVAVQWKETEGADQVLLHGPGTEGREPSSMAQGTSADR